MKKIFLVVIFFIIPTITFANFKNIPKFKNNILFFQIWLNKNNYSDFLSNEKLGNSDYFKTNLNLLFGIKIVYSVIIINLG